VKREKEISKCGYPAAYSKPVPNFYLEKTAQFSYETYFIMVTKPRKDQQANEI